MIRAALLLAMPTTAGTFSLTIRVAAVTCAGKPMGDQHVTVSLTVR